MVCPDGKRQNQQYQGQLTKDIDLAGFPWTPIGNTSKGFAGELDGAGFAVRNLYIYSTADNQGLIGRLGANGKVHDLTVTGSVTTTGNTAGGIVGYAPAKTSVSNCLNEADVTAKTCAMLFLALSSPKILWYLPDHLLSDLYYTMQPE